MFFQSVKSEKHTGVVYVMSSHNPCKDAFSSLFVMNDLSTQENSCIEQVISIQEYK